MIVRCTDCSSKYEIAASKIPDGGVKVRCPKCKAVFPVTAPAAIPAGAAAAEITQERRAPAPAPAPAPPSQAKPPVRPALSAVPGTGPAADGGSGQVKRGITDPQVARRMARAVVQELLLARRQEHEESLKTGTVLGRFGQDIADAFDLYAEKVSEDLSGRRTIFLEAVNQVLGNGQRLL